MVLVEIVKIEALMKPIFVTKIPLDGNKSPSNDVTSEGCRYASNVLGTRRVIENFSDKISIFFARFFYLQLEIFRNIFFAFKIS